MKIITNKIFENLKVGDLIKVKSLEEIEKTLDSDRRYKRTYFPYEMNFVCNKVFKIFSIDNEKVFIKSESNYWCLREPWIIII